MFPAAKMDPSLFLPVTHSNFLQRILVPETALRMIMEDLELTGEQGIKEALKVLRDSSAYGAGMFPDNGGEGGHEECMTAGDKIVMERARKKQRQIQLQEGVDQLEDASSARQTGATVRLRPRPRPRFRTRNSDTERG